jgi:hypothetical protein
MMIFLLLSVFQNSLMLDSNNPSSPMDMPPGYGQRPVPNSVGALVLGIISIPTCACWGIVGLVCGIIAVVLGSKALALYKQHPEMYTRSSYNNANAGRICGIIGTCLSALYFIYVIVFLIIYGTLVSSAISGGFFDQMNNP